MKEWLAVLELYCTFSIHLSLSFAKVFFDYTLSNKNFYLSGPFICVKLKSCPLRKRVLLEITSEDFTVNEFLHAWKFLDGFEEEEEKD
jgi:hypothetical protein